MEKKAKLLLLVISGEILFSTLGVRWVMFHCHGSGFLRSGIECDISENIMKVFVLPHVFTLVWFLALKKIVVNASLLRTVLLLIIPPTLIIITSFFLKIKTNFAMALIFPLWISLFPRAKEKVEILAQRKSIVASALLPLAVGTYISLIPHFSVANSITVNVYFLFSISVVSAAILFISMFIGFRLSSTILLLAGLLLSFANIIKMSYLESPVLVSDMILIGDLLRMLSSSDIFLFKLVSMSAAGLLISSAITLLIYKIYLKKMDIKISSRVILFSVSFTVSLFIFPKVKELNVSTATFGIIGETGYITWLILEGLKSMSPSPPHEYSPERVREIKEKWLKNKQGKGTKRNGGKIEASTVNEYPNIVVYFVESFSDPQRIHGFEVKPDPLENIRKMLEEGYYGDMLVPTFGGESPKTAFEVLTGLPQRFYSGVIFPIIKKKIFSIPWYLKSLGYKTFCVFNYSSPFYNETRALLLLGISELHFADNWKREGRAFNIDIDGIAKFISIGERINTREGRPFFGIFFGMESHQPYNFRLEDSIDFEIKFKGRKIDKVEYKTYFNLIKNVSLSLREIVKWAENVERKTVVLALSDHLPPLELFRELKGNGKYKVPAFVWCNFKCRPTKRDFLMSSNWILVRILKNIGFEMPDYLEILYKMSEAYPVLPDDENEMVKDLHTLFYDNVFGERYFWSDISFIF